MLPTSLINAIQIFSRGSKPLITDSAPNPVTPIELGKQLQGAVQSKISNGLFKVLVSGQLYQLRLPDTTRSGDIINLKVVSNKPQMSFSLIAASNAPISTQEQIGPTARLLADLARLPLERPTTQEISGAAVWQVADIPPEASKLASALRDALSQSGLFYESHQAQWVLGERSTAQLLVEPQNQATGKNLTPNNPALNTSTVAMSSNDQNTQSVLADNRPTSSSTQPIAKELLPLVQQQLHALETHQLTWSGQVWPGQQMQWEIQGQPEHQATMPDERRWSTEMELAMKKLGDVHAKLTFTNDGLKLVLNAADDVTLALFNRAMPQLQSALANVDIPLLASTVERT